jgi:hypothetical protein
MRSTDDEDYAAQSGDMIFFHRDDGALSFDTMNKECIRWIAAESKMLCASLKQLFDSPDISDTDRAKIVRRIAARMARSHGLSDAKLVGIGRHIFSVVLI